MLLECLQHHTLCTAWRQKNLQIVTNLDMACAVLNMHRQSCAGLSCTGFPRPGVCSCCFWPAP